MKLFLDTANIAAIKRWKETGLINGITTNPSHLSKEGGNPKDVVLEICKLLPEGEISVEITQQEPEAVYEQAKEIAKLADNILVKVPCHKDYYSIIHRLVADGINLNITLVFTLIQGMMMCKLGVRYISPFVGRWDDIDVEGFKLLKKMKDMIYNYGFDTGVLAASLRGVRHIHHAIMAGADAATVPIAVFEKAQEHLLTDRGIEKFDADWQKLGIKKFP